MEFEIKGSVWGTLSLRCQVDIQVEISSGQLAIPAWPAVGRSELKIRALEPLVSNSH